MPEDSRHSRTTERWGNSRQTKRLPAEKTRERLLSTALEMLRHTGLTVSLEHLNMEVLIREADVPRSSVFRLWGSKSKFFADLMLELVKPENGANTAFDPETITTAQAVVQEYAYLLETEQGREVLLREVIRQGVARNYAAVISVHTWKTHSALVATLPTVPDDSRELVLAALSQSDRQYTRSVAALYESLLPVFHRRVKDGLTCMEIAAAGASLVQGLSEKELVLPDVVRMTIMRPGPTGEPVEWTLAAIAYFGIIESMTESIDETS